MERQCIYRSKGVLKVIACILIRVGGASRSIGIFSNTVALAAEQRAIMEAKGKFESKLNQAGCELDMQANHDVLDRRSIVGKRENSQRLTLAGIPHQSSPW